MLLLEVFYIQLCRFHYDSKPKLVATVDFLVRGFLFFFGRKTWNREIDVEIAPELSALAIHLKPSKLQKCVENAII